MGGGICDSLMADNLCLVFVFLVTSQSNEKNKSRLSLRYDCANYSWLFGDNPDLWKPECIDVLSSKKNTKYYSHPKPARLGLEPAPSPAWYGPRQKNQNIYQYICEMMKKKCVLWKKQKDLYVFMC